MVRGAGAVVRPSPAMRARSSTWRTVLAGGTGGQHDERKAHEVIDQVPATHPFELRYDRIEQVDWESCSTVLHSRTQLEPLLEGW